jgi:cold shock CspA family protein
MQRQKGEITTWHQEVQWGFATTREGNIVFVHKSAFSDRRQPFRTHCGSIIEFDSQETRTAEQHFLDKLLNSGKYRDEPTIARSHRNPRRDEVSNRKPRAVNVVLVPERSDKCLT